MTFDSLTQRVNDRQLLLLASSPTGVDRRQIGVLVKVICLLLLLDHGQATMLLLIFCDI